MGCNFFAKNCSSYKGCSQNDVTPRPAPNPDPARWKLLQKEEYVNAYVLHVRYLDCTNFEGRKVMVYRGKYDPEVKELDPHFFEEDPKLIARFRPTQEGWDMACVLASAIIF